MAGWDWLLGTPDQQAAITNNNFSNPIWNRMGLANSLGQASTAIDQASRQGAGPGTLLGLLGGTLGGGAQQQAAALMELRTRQQQQQQQQQLFPLQLQSAQMQLSQAQQMNPLLLAKAQADVRTAQLLPETTLIEQQLKRQELARATALVQMLSGGSSAAPATPPANGPPMSGGVPGGIGAVDDASNLTRPLQYGFEAPQGGAGAPTSFNTSVLTPAQQTLLSANRPGFSPPAASNSGTSGSTAVAPTGDTGAAPVNVPSAFDAPISYFSATTGVPKDILAGVIKNESGFNPNVGNSPKGAAGFGQFMPGTAAQYGVNVNDPIDSIRGAAEYLRDLHNQFGDWGKAVAAYNAGPGRVASGVDLPDETKKYVNKIFPGGANNIQLASLSSGANDLNLGGGFGGPPMPNQPVQSFQTAGAPGAGGGVAAGAPVSSGSLFGGLSLPSQAAPTPQSAAASPNAGVDFATFAKGLSPALKQMLAVLPPEQAVKSMMEWMNKPKTQLVTLPNGGLANVSVDPISGATKYEPVIPGMSAKEQYDIANPPRFRIETAPDGTQYQVKTMPSGEEERSQLKAGLPVDFKMKGEVAARKAFFEESNENDLTTVAGAARIAFAAYHDYLHGNASPAADTSIIHSFVKTLDPHQVARQGVVQYIEDNPGIKNMVQQLQARFSSVGKIGEDARREIMHQIENAYGQTVEQHDVQVDEFRKKQLKPYGLDENVIDHWAGPLTYNDWAKLHGDNAGTAGQAGVAAPAPVPVQTR